MKTAKARTLAERRRRLLRVLVIIGLTLPVLVFDVYLGEPRGVAFSPDGQWVVSAHDHGKIRIWDTASGRLVREFPPKELPPLESVAVSPDGRLVGVGQQNGAVRLFETRTGQQTKSPDLKNAVWVTSIVFSPDGSRLACGHWDGKVHVADASTGAVLAGFEARGSPVLSLAFSGEARLLAAGHADGTVRVFEVASQREITLLTGRAGGITSLAFSPDGKSLAAGGANGSVRLWEIATDRELRQWDGNRGPLIHLAFGPDEALIAGAAEDSVIGVRTLAGSGPAQRLAGHEGTVTSVDLHLARGLAASCGRDRTVRVWSLNSGRELWRQEAGDFRIEGRAAIMKLPEAAQAVFIILSVILVLFALMAAAFYVISALVPRKVRAVGFSANGQLLAVQAGWDILVLDPSTGQERWGRPISFMGAFTFVAAAGLQGSLRCAFASETSVLAAADPGGIFLYDAASGKRLRSFRMELDPRGIAISPDGNTVVVAHKKGLQLWVTGTVTLGRLPNLTHHPGPLNCAAFSPDGALLATGGDGIALWDLQRSQVIARLAGHDASVTSVVFSPAGDRLVSGSEDATVRVWEVASRAEVQRLSGHSGPVTSVAVNPDGRVAASAGADGTVRLWDLERGQELRRLDGHTNRVNAVAFSRDGAQVVSGGDDRSVWVWDAASGAPLRQSVAKRAGLFGVRFVVQ